MKKRHIYIMVGVPGVGKSTIAKEISEKMNIPIVSRDEIRFSLVKDKNSYFSKEKLVYKIFIDTINKTILEKDSDVIVDATHISKASRNKLFNCLSEETKKVSDFTAIVVLSDLESIKKRNAQRTGIYRVPDKVIEDMFNSFEYPNENWISFIEKRAVIDTSLFQ